MRKDPDFQGATEDKWEGAGGKGQKPLMDGDPEAKATSLIRSPRHPGRAARSWPRPLSSSTTSWRHWLSVLLPILGIPLVSFKELQHCAIFLSFAF